MRSIQRINESLANVSISPLLHPPLTASAYRTSPRARPWTALEMSVTHTSLSSINESLPRLARARAHVDAGRRRDGLIIRKSFGRSRTPIARARAVSDVDVPDATILRVRYHRTDGSSYAGWGAHAWGDVRAPTTWDAPLAATLDDYSTWATFDVELVSGASRVSVLIHRGEDQDCRAEDLDVSAGTREVWLVSGYSCAFEQEPDLKALPKGDVDKHRAIWVSASVIAVPPDFALSAAARESVKYSLVSSESAELRVTGEGVEGGDGEPQTLELVPTGLSKGAREKFPHIAAADYRALELPPSAPVRDLLRRQLAVAAVDEDGAPVDATGVQLQGALDELYAYDGPLGAEFGSDNLVTLRVWAPTAQNVTLSVFDEPRGDATRIEKSMTRDSRTGVWSVSGEFDGKFYNYNVTVFNPSTGQVSTNVSSDPYARSLAADGRRAHVCDISKDDLKPAGWESFEKPTFTHPVDCAIYELHIRDFSAMDDTVSSAARGKYVAFTESSSTCVSHLRKLAQAGLTHVHLLPSYDFGSVPELPENQKSVDFEQLAALPSNSSKQQELIEECNWCDAFNWGYDPVHYGVPEGSYSTDADGSRRVLEYREMVKSLAENGLRVICDVVYNHTLSSGPSDVNSVLDKIVPGYYHRRNFDGFIEASTCCNNTASEHYMMDRLIVDDLVHWARSYKVDGFRFDLMGHLMLSTMLKAKKALNSLTLERDGVDGKSLYLYGEGWDYAEVAQGRVGKNASQLNLAHTGIGSFNDRVREGCIGGSPFADPRLQGFLTGLYYSPNGVVQQGDEESQRYRMMEDGERILAALAGNVRDFAYVDRHGVEVMASSAVWPNSNVAYAGEPEETVNYVSAHDNETLFDSITLRVADSISLAERCRINHVATAIVALAQGVPFFHAGDEILRSKSLDRDSYSSGDWFNRLDYSGETHNFGVGLPPARKNGDRYAFITEMLADLSMRPTKENIHAATKNLCELLSIRRSTPLLRLRSSHDIQRRMKFYNRGPAQTPGLIIASINDGDASTPGLQALDSNYKRIVLAINATPRRISHEEAGLKVDFAGVELKLHPLISDAVAAESSVVDGAYTIPPYTWAVFVQCR